MKEPSAHRCTVSELAAALLVIEQEGHGDSIVAVQDIVNDERFVVLAYDNAPFTAEFVDDPGLGGPNSDAGTTFLSIVHP